MVVADVMNVVARARVIEALYEGDPVAWTILVVVVLGAIALSVIKKRRGG